MKKIIWAGALLPLVATSALAAVSVQTFTPAEGTSYVFAEDALMQIAPGDSSWTGERLYFHLIYNYVNQPLVEFDPTHTTRDNILINGINTFDLGIGILPLKNLMLSLNMPMNFENQPNSSTQFGWGDMRLEMKWRFTDDDAPVAVALLPNVYLPTGDAALFMSNNSVGLGMSLVVERDFGPFRVSGNIGYRHYSDGVYQDINYSNMIPMILGAYIPINDHWGINVEGAGSLSLPVNHYNNPGEFYVGGHYQMSRDASFLLGGSTGSVGGGGSGNFRVIAGIKFSPMDLLVAKKPEPKPVPVVVPAPRPQPAVKPSPKPVRKPLVKPSPKPSPKKKPVAKKKPAKKKPVKKKPKPKPSAARDANGVTITTTTTTTTETKIAPGAKPKAPAMPQPPANPGTTNSIGNPQP